MPRGVVNSSFFLLLFAIRYFSFIINLIYVVRRNLLSTIHALRRRQGCLTGRVLHAQLQSRPIPSNFSRGFIHPPACILFVVRLGTKKAARTPPFCIGGTTEIMVRNCEVVALQNVIYVQLTLLRSGLVVNPHTSGLSSLAMVCS